MNSRRGAPVVDSPVSESTRKHLVTHHLLHPQEVPTDQSTSKLKKCLMDIGSLFVTHAQAAKLIEPGEGSFYHPSPSA
jgi:hypothetical protein